jgi:hypothetical protein
MLMICLKEFFKQFFSFKDFKNVLYLFLSTFQGLHQIQWLFNALWEHCILKRDLNVMCIILKQSFVYVNCCLIAAIPNLFSLKYPLNTLFILEYPLHSQSKLILNKSQKTNITYNYSSNTQWKLHFLLSN